MGTHHCGLSTQAISVGVSVNKWSTGLSETECDHVFYYLNLFIVDTYHLCDNFILSGRFLHFIS